MTETKEKPLGRRSILKLLAASVTAPIIGPVISTAIPPTATASECSFLLSDCTYYPNINLGAEAGIVRSQFVPGGPFTEWTGRTPPEPPPETDFKNYVQQRNNRGSGPLVLDFENIWLNILDEELAEQRALVNSQLLIWAREVAPTQQIGLYGMLSNTRMPPSEPEYVALAQQISEFEDAFFPQLYTGELDWPTKVDDAVRRAALVDPSMPLLPFISPRYWGGPNQGDWIDGEIWRGQLDLLLARPEIDGAVIWDNNVTLPESDRDWVDATVSFMEDC